MAFLDRLLGRNITLDTPAPPTTDDQAVERYEYLLRTAKPDTIEQAHVDAFERLTHEQRDVVFGRFLADSPAGERPADAEPATLAKAATVAETREPGFLIRTFRGERSDAGDTKATTGPVGGSFLSSVATYAVASSAIDAIFWAGLIGTTVVASNTASPDTSDSTDVGADSGSGFDFFGALDF